ncbi:hypothetical protein HL666_07670 [Bradyrhizobium sp. 83002]|uniref:hypothetical protein n=1 Tax=Bradyrhizobium aeschynomenes TaxID=2734909 RepID=UPI0015549253|nr:hypothetical protein [Bradyrhizobium aeschynomenes]NPU10633.1 hypothetical protein [Bradyrhizobium aeschynomenes]
MGEAFTRHSPRPCMFARDELIASSGVMRRENFNLRPRFSDRCFSRESAASTVVVPDKPRRAKRGVAPIRDPYAAAVMLGKGQ